MEHSVGETSPDLQYILQRMTDIMAHDIRNPLNNILLSTAQFKLDPPPSVAESEAYIEIIERSCDRVNNLLNHFAQAIRAPALQPAWHEPLIWLNALAEEYADRASLKDISFEADLDINCRIFADPECLQKAVAALLDNALDASVAGGTILFNAGQKDAQLIITVEDKGEGIAPAVLPHIFTPFYTTRQRHKGLGLSIARHIFDAQQVNYSIKSDSTGTRLRLELACVEKSDQDSV